MSKEKAKVLFICEHNAARSQMAEALLKSLAENKFDVESAGLEPGTLNLFAVEAMREIGIDISQNKTKSVFDLFKQDKHYDYVITVCDESQSGRCPIFPGVAQRLHWSFEDPSTFQGNPSEKLQKIRNLRDTIKARIIEWIRNFK